MDAPDTTSSPAVTLSDAALKEVKRLINVQGLTEGGLRLGVKGGGCSGLSYTINFDDKIGQYDTTYDFDGVKVIIDAKSAMAPRMRISLGWSPPVTMIEPTTAMAEIALVSDMSGVCRRRETRAMTPMPMNVERTSTKSIDQ